MCGYFIDLCFLNSVSLKLSLIKSLKNYFIVFNKINNHYKAFSVLVFDQAHPEFLVLAQNFHFSASLPFTLTTYRILFATTFSFKGSHTHTHQYAEIFKRVYSPNNFKLMLLKNILMLCIWTLVFASYKSHNSSKRQ